MELYQGFRCFSDIFHFRYTETWIRRTLCFIRLVFKLYSHCFVAAFSDWPRIIALKPTKDMQYSRIGDVIEGKKLDCKIREVNSTFSPVQQPVPDPKCNTNMLIIDDADIEREFSVTLMLVTNIGDKHKMLSDVF